MKPARDLTGRLCVWGRWMAAMPAGGAHLPERNCAGMPQERSERGTDAEGGKSPAPPPPRHEHKGGRAIGSAAAAANANALSVAGKNRTCQTRSAVPVMSLGPGPRGYARFPGGGIGMREGARSEGPAGSWQKFEKEKRPHGLEPLAGSNRPMPVKGSKPRSQNSSAANRRHTRSPRADPRDHLGHDSSGRHRRLRRINFVPDCLAFRRRGFQPTKSAFRSDRRGKDKKTQTPQGRASRAGASRTKSHCQPCRGRATPFG